MVHSFYHGTSELFLDSIINKGLGGINPNIEYGFLDILRYLYSTSEDLIVNDERYLKIRTTTKSMAAQCILSYPGISGAEKLNFEHGHTYVSCLQERAILYAKNNEFGSEILTRIIHLYRLIKDSIRNFSIPKDIDSIDIDQISKNKIKPVLIRLNDIEPYELLTEFGEPSDRIIDLIFHTSADYDKEWVNQNGNFRLVNPIEKSRLKLYKLDR